jgi:hypothetical protein
MSKIIDAQSCVECIFDIGDETDPIQTVAGIASKKIEEAIALLDEYRTPGLSTRRSP